MRGSRWRARGWRCRWPRRAGSRCWRCPYWWVSGRWVAWTGGRPAGCRSRAGPRWRRCRTRRGGPPGSPVIARSAPRLSATARRRSPCIPRRKQSRRRASRSPTRCSVTCSSPRSTRAPRGPPASRHRRQTRHRDSGGFGRFTYVLRGAGNRCSRARVRNARPAGGQVAGCQTSRMRRSRVGWVRPSRTRPATPSSPEAGSTATPTCSAASSATTPRSLVSAAIRGAKPAAWQAVSSVARSLLARVRVTIGSACSARSGIRPRSAKGWVGWTATTTGSRATSRDSASGGQRGKQRVGLILHQRQLDPRVTAMERADQMEEAPVGEGVDQADGQAAGEQAAERHHCFAPDVSGLKRCARVGEQGLAGLGQPDAAAVAQEQALAEFCFQAADLLADGGLRDRDPLGGAGEVALLSDRHEVGELPQLHKQTLSFSDCSCLGRIVWPGLRSKSLAAKRSEAAVNPTVIMPASETPQHRGQPRAKLALLTWAGAYAVILLVLTIGGPAMARWPLAVRALVLSGVMVAAMTWVIVPAMTRLFRRWLLR